MYDIKLFEICEETLNGDKVIGVVEHLDSAKAIERQLKKDGVFYREKNMVVYSNTSEFFESRKEKEIEKVLAKLSPAERKLLGY